MPSKSVWVLNVFTCATSGISIIAILLVLFLTIRIIRNPLGARSLDKSTLRLCLQLLCVCLVYTVLTALSVVKLGGNQPCTAYAFITAFTCILLGGLCATINFNLVLVIVYEKFYEKYLVLAAWVIAFGATVPVLIMKQWGLDPVQEICWITIPLSTKRIVTEVFSCSFWLVLQTIGGILVAFVVIINIRRSIELNAMLREHRWKVIMRIFTFPFINLQITVAGVVGEFLLDARAYRFRAEGVTPTEDASTFAIWCCSNIMLSGSGLFLSCGLLFLNPIFLNEFKSLWKATSTIERQDALENSISKDVIVVVEEKKHSLENRRNS